MYQESIQHFATLARRKSDYLKENPLGFFVAAMMAGAYVGVGIILIFTLGQAVPPPAAKLVMGLSFGIALTLVVFAGSELFTGHTMYMTLGLLTRRTGLANLSASWGMTWAGNLAGALLLCLIFTVGGGGDLLDDPQSLLHRVAGYKMNSEASALVARAILCNWLVCLALWMAARTKSDAAKCIVIFWCLFAFIASGFEHSVANMTVLGLSLLGDHPDSVSIAGMAHNLIWVTLGNIIGGAVFMALAYRLASGMKKPSA